MQEKITQVVQPTITYPTLVGQVILKHRKSLGIDQSAMAQALGITQPAYSRLEQGNSVLSITQLRTIAHVLKFKPGSLMREVDQLEDRMISEGVAITEEKGIEPGAILIGLGILAALIAST